MRRKCPPPARKYRLALTPPWFFFHGEGDTHDLPFFFSTKGPPPHPSSWYCFSPTSRISSIFFYFFPFFLPLSRCYGTEGSSPQTLPFPPSAFVWFKINHDFHLSRSDPAVLSLTTYAPALFPYSLGAAFPPLFAVFLRIPFSPSYFFLPPPPRGFITSQQVVR